MYIWLALPSLNQYDINVYVHDIKYAESRGFPLEIA